MEKFTLTFCKLSHFIYYIVYLVSSGLFENVGHFFKTPVVFSLVKKKFKSQSRTERCHILIFSIYFLLEMMQTTISPFSRSAPFGTSFSFGLVKCFFQRTLSQFLMITFAYLGLLRRTISLQIFERLPSTSFTWSILEYFDPL